MIGGGRFGCLALERLGKRVRAVVEPRPTPHLEELASVVGVPVILKQGVSALSQALSSENPPVWVVPALPRHLLMDWLLEELAPQGAHRLDTPAEALPSLPSVLPGEDGQWFLSRADFLCPDDCPEPAGKCTVTGQPRGEPLFERLARLVVPGRHTVVLRSHQLAPGVGGYRAADLLALRERLAAGGGCWLLATACRCHGVVGSLGLETKE